jgi:hypothetical protein
MTLPPSSHFIYIPAILILGLVLGFIWGARMTREALRLEQRAADERARRKAARAAERDASPPERSRWHEGALAGVKRTAEGVDSPGP